MNERELIEALEEVDFVTPADKCENPTGCALGGFCLRAEVIKAEAAYEIRGMTGNALASKLSGAKCDHLQTKKMIELCTPLLEANNNE